MNRTSISHFALLSFGLCVLPALAAQDEIIVDQSEPNSGRLHFSGGVDFTTQYFFRGILQEDSGLIVQPWIEGSFDLLTNEEIALSVVAGSWNSFHDEATGASTGDHFVKEWYESDWYAGLALDRGNWSFGVYYIAYASPNGAFSTVNEFDLTFAFDDSEHLGKWALSPSATIAIETGSDAADGGMTGVYLELGIAPGFSPESGPLESVTFSFPVTVGLSLDDYYEDATGNDDTFGYFDIGAEASIDLPVPSDVGVWSFTVGVHGLFLGDNLETINGGSDAEVIFSTGFSFAY